MIYNSYFKFTIIVFNYAQSLHIKGNIIIEMELKRVVRIGVLGDGATLIPSRMSKRAMKVSQRNLRETTKMTKI